jgi:hypothetical protein
MLELKASLSADDFNYWFMITTVTCIRKCQSESYFKGLNGAVKTEGENYMNCKLHTINSEMELHSGRIIVKAVIKSAQNYSVSTSD